MAEDYCELYDMPASMCAHCRGNKSAEEMAEVETLALRAQLLATDHRWFASQFPGRCAKCGLPFQPEALIRRGHGNDLLPDTAYIAECCAVI
jgi:hypothetical protein